MAYQAVIMLGQAYSFIGDYIEAEKWFSLAEPFTPDRNEHWLYWAIHLNSIGEYKKSLNIIETLLKKNNLNPFPKKCFLIEDRAYTNTSNFIYEFKSNLLNKII